MGRNAFKHGAVVAATVFCAAGLSTSPANAVGDGSKPAPAVSFKFAHKRVTEHTKLRLTSTVSHLPRRSHVVLQRQYGTRHVWKTVRTLKVAQGDNTVSGVEYGKYQYRTAAIDRSGALIATSAPRVLFSYGTFSSRSICRGSDHTLFNACGSGSAQVGGNVFSYQHWGGGNNTGPDGDPNVVAQQSSCRSLAISFAVSNNGVDDGVTEYGAAMSTANADQQRAEGTVGGVSTTTFTMGSKAWDLILWTDTGNDYVYWTGTFSCFTADGDA